ncbi:MAG TPA: hypothetical protein VHR86_05480 [Armatimonadota bacterium]|nr:hypothetical protein [Armatimonadota bacterium]
MAQQSAGLLSDHQERWLKEHLAHCAHCAAEQKAFDGVLHMLDSVPPLMPPPRMWDGVAAQIRAEQKTSWLHGRRRWAPVLATGTALALAGGLALFHQQEAPLPLFPVENVGYMENHALLSRGDPFADRLSLASFVTAAERDSEQEENHR